METLGWVVLVAGLLALVLPGPGLLLTFAGLVILSTQYTWARRLMEPVRVKAWRGAAEGVETIPRMVLSTLGALAIMATGIFWLLAPPAPTWWPVDESFWLFGGPAVGVTLVVSSVIALGLLVFAARRFRGRPDQLAWVEEMETRHRRRVRSRREARRRLRRLRESR